MSRLYLYGILLVFIGGVIYKWHYLPLQQHEDKLQSNKIELANKDIVINNLSVELQEVVQNNKVVGFEEYFKGFSDENISINTDKLIF